MIVHHSMLRSAYCTLYHQIIHTRSESAAHGVSSQEIGFHSDEDSLVVENNRMCVQVLEQALNSSKAHASIFSFIRLTAVRSQIVLSGTSEMILIIHVLIEL